MADFKNKSDNKKPPPGPAVADVVNAAALLHVNFEKKTSNRTFRECIEEASNSELTGVAGVQLTSLCQNRPNLSSWVFQYIFLSGNRMAQNAPKKLVYLHRPIFPSTYPVLIPLALRDEDVENFLGQPSLTNPPEVTPPIIPAATPWVGMLDIPKEFIESPEWALFFSTSSRWRLLLSKTMELVRCYLAKSPLWIPPLWLDILVFRFHLALASEFLAKSDIHWTGPEPLVIVPDSELGFYKVVKPGTVESPSIAIIKFYIHTVSSMRKDAMETCIVPAFLQAVLVDIPRSKGWELDSLRNYFNTYRTVDGYASFTHPSIHPANPNEPSPAYTGHIINALMCMFALDPKNHTSLLYHPQSCTYFRTSPPHAKVPWWVLVNVTAMANYLTRRLTDLLDSLPSGVVTGNLYNVIMPTTFTEPSGGFFAAFEADQSYALDRAIKTLSPGGVDKDRHNLPDAYLKMDDAWTQWCVMERGCIWTEANAPPPPVRPPQRRKLNDIEKGAFVGDKVQYPPGASGNMVQVLLPPEGGTSLRIF